MVQTASYASSRCSLSERVGGSRTGRTVVCELVKRPLVKGNF